MSLYIQLDRAPQWSVLESVPFNCHSDNCELHSIDYKNEIVTSPTFPLFLCEHDWTKRLWMTWFMSQSSCLCDIVPAGHESNEITKSAALYYIRKHFFQSPQIISSRINVIIIYKHFEWIRPYDRSAVPFCKWESGSTVGDKRRQSSADEGEENLM